MEETKRRRFIIRAVLEGEVDVHEEPVPPLPPGVLYQLPGELVLDGTNYVDTGLQFYAADRSYTFAFSFTTGELVNDMLLFNCTDAFNNNTGLMLRYYNNNHILMGQKKNIVTTVPGTEGITYKMVVHHAADDTHTYVSRVTGNDLRGNNFNSDGFYPSSNNLVIGGMLVSGQYQHLWKGTIHDFTIYDHDFTAAEITEYLGM